MWFYFIRSSGLQQICKLWFGVGKGVLPVKHLTPQIFIPPNYCGCQVARRLGGRHLPTIKRMVPSLIPEHASIACSMTGGLVGALCCEMACGILVIYIYIYNIYIYRLEKEGKLVKNRERG